MKNLSIRAKCSVASALPTIWMALVLLIGGRLLHLRVEAKAYVLFSASIVVAGIGAICAWSLLSRWIRGRIARLVESASMVAMGLHVEFQDSSRDELGQLASAFVSMSRQVSEHKAESIEVSARLEAILRASKSVSILAENVEGRITICNPGAERLLGCRQSDILGRYLNDIVHPAAEMASRPGMVAALKTARHEAAKNSLQEYENVYVRADGVCLDVELSVTAMKDMNGHILGFLHVAHDITPRKVLEAELRQKNDQLKSQAPAASYSKEEDARLLNNLRDGAKTAPKPLEPSSFRKNDWYEDLDEASPDKQRRIKRSKILIVDDFEATRALMSAYLKDLDCDLDFAGDGVEALDRVASEDYCLVLMDIEMPRMDGHETARRIRLWETQEGRIRLPLIAMTAHTIENRQAAHSAWTSSLCKPLSKAQLLQELGRHLKTA